jgi:hypothetical protein
MYIMFDYVNAGFQLSSRKHENIKGEKLEPVLGPGIRKAKGPLDSTNCGKTHPRRGRKPPGTSYGSVCV